MSAPDLFSILRLHLATLFHNDVGALLLDRFGDASEVFRQPQRELRELVGRRPRLLDRLVDVRTARRAEAELRRVEAGAVSCLVRGQTGFPAGLVDLPDVPLVLFAQGRLDPADERSVGVIGSRRPSPYALEQTDRFCAVLAPLGVAIVSGFARGVDVRGHRAAIDACGRTVAVLGSGLGRIYPPEHEALARRVVEDDRGAILSEFPFEAAPKAYHFPRRNRVLSGMSRAILVMEAGERSGSLITVRWALEQGRSVYVLPGRVDQERALGGLRLLQDGAAPALGPEDLLADLGIAIAPEERTPRDSSVSPAAEARAVKLDGELAEPLNELFGGAEEWHPDRLSERLPDVPPEKLLGELSRLELEGALVRAANGAYRVRASLTGS